MEHRNCPACGGRLIEAPPHGSYIESETCCIDCGFVEEAVIVFTLSQEQIDRITEDLDKIGGDIKILGSNPLNEETLLNILKERTLRHIKEILKIIRIKITTCIDCRRVIEYTTKKPRRCPECQRKYRAEYMRKRRAKKKRNIIS